MSLRTSDQYRKAVTADGRTLFYRGRRSTTSWRCPSCGSPLDHAAIDYEVAEDPAHRDLAVAVDPDTGEASSAYYRIPRSRRRPVAARSALIELCTAPGRHAGHPDQGDRLRRPVRHAAPARRRRSWSGREAFHGTAATATWPWPWPRPTSRATGRARPTSRTTPTCTCAWSTSSDEGIVVRGAKCHTSSSANADEIIVLPTRAMGPDDADYAVAFAVPANTARPVDVRLVLRRPATATRSSSRSRRATRCSRR